MSSPKRLRLAAIGCGSRTFIYFELAAKQPELYEIVAAADHTPARRSKARALSQNPQFREFNDDVAILAEPKLADLMIIATQDAFHFAHASAALRKGYDLLLEVRADPSLAEIPFIMVTAESKTENVIAAKKAGVNNYIVKPFNAQTLQNKIEAVFAEAKAA